MMGHMRATKQVGASDFDILIHMTTLLERLVASEPVQRALDRMEDVKVRGGIDGMIAATARRVKAMNTPEKLRAMEIAVESFITADTDGLTMQQVRQLRQIAQDARAKINESRVREFVRLVLESQDDEDLVDELDDNEDEGEELDEFSGCAGVAGYTAPLGANPSGSTPKKRATWK